MRLLNVRCLECTLTLKGALVCSHLSDSDLRCVVLFCNAHRLLELTAAESVNQIVIWRQVGFGLGKRGGLGVC